MPAPSSGTWSPQAQETLDIVTKRGSLHLTLTGTGVASTVTCSIEGDVLHMGYVIAGESVSSGFKVEHPPGSGCRPLPAPRPLPGPLVDSLARWPCPSLHAQQEGRPGPGCCSPDSRAQAGTPGMPCPGQGVLSGGEGEGGVPVWLEASLSLTTKMWPTGTARVPPAGLPGWPARLAP